MLGRLPQVPISALSRLILRRRCGYEPACTAEGLVGLNGTWYCLEHFDVRMKEVGDFCKRVRGMFSATMRPADESLPGAEVERPLKLC